MSQKKPTFSSSHGQMQVQQEKAREVGKNRWREKSEIQASWTWNESKDPWVNDFPGWMSSESRLAKLEDKPPES